MDSPSSAMFVAPAASSTYKTLRPNLRIDEDPALQLPADPTLQWHPNAKPLSDLHQLG